MRRLPRDLIVVGASAGGVEALRDLVAGLPAGLPACVLVVLHLPAGGTSALPAILDRAGPLPVRSATDGEPLEHGAIHVAPPNHHLLVVDGRLALSHGPTENGRRPAIDALFRSAAIVAGPRVTGVLLSGVLDDGIAGLRSIAGRGGKVVVQDPDEALYPGMPRQAMAAVEVDHVLPVGAMGTILDKLCREEVEPNGAPEPTLLLRLENTIATTDLSAPFGHEPEASGQGAGLTCPDCDDALVEMALGSRYQCRGGHAWAAETLLNAQGLAWERGSTRFASRYELHAQEALEAATLPRAPLDLADRRTPEGMSSDADRSAPG
ncbi:MAG: chemotaxis protein CheB [Actinophytocola sp.]|uniref:chemotaxis protein CheB n=1 Tax=Actinophytocola sp. TaxID=1872138 RepID=UPI003D6B917A